MSHDTKNIIIGLLICAIVFIFGIVWAVRKSATTKGSVECSTSYVQRLGSDDCESSHEAAEYQQR